MQSHANNASCSFAEDVLDRRHVLCEEAGGRNCRGSKRTHDSFAVPIILLSISTRSSSFGTPKDKQGPVCQDALAVFWPDSETSESILCLVDAGHVHAPVAPIRTKA